MKRNQYFAQEQEKMMMTIGNETITYGEWKKRKQQAKKSQHKQKVEAYVKTLFPYINRIVKQIRVLQTLCSYYDYGKRYWGHKVVDFVFNNEFISQPFTNYRLTAYKFKSTLADIEKLSEKNEKDIFQFIQKLSWNIDDARTALQTLTRAVSDSRVCEFYSKEKFIYEEGRRPGLSIIMTNVLLSMNELNKLIDELDNIAEEGLGNFGYDTSTNFIQRIA